MGVPRLFPWITRKYRNQVSHFPFRENSKRIVDYLYLDSNGLLHGAAQKVFNYGSEKCMLNSYEGLTFDQKRRAVFDLYFDKVKQVYETIRPQKVLYVAIDGPAPLAKQAQQRQRRFVSAKERSGQEFDSNCISPGTIFMSELDMYLRYRIRKEMNTSQTLMGVKVIYSPPSVPGEGEHKIMDYIKDISEKERQESSHCMFGPDGDLIMLTMATHLPKISLFRHDMYRPGFFHLLEMGVISKEMSNHMKNRSPTDTSNDFIVMSMFVGNDFLPKIQMFHLLEDGLDVMFANYKSTTEVLTQNNKMTLEGLKSLINKLKVFESPWLLDQILTTNKFKKPPGPKFENKTLSSCVDNSNLNFSQYEKNYYNKCKIKNQKEIDEMCKDYLKTLLWVFEYYVNGLPDWRWAYEHHYAPLMSSFSQYISNLSTEEFEEIYTFEKKQASLPFEQLLSILPPESSHLLPIPYSKLMFDETNEMAENYPKSFEIDYEGKLKEYQGVALLPFVDYEKTQRNVRQIHSRKYNRNILGSVMMFYYNKTYKSSYSSRYGKIEKLSVKCVNH